MGKRKAFTLVEVMIVILIIAILLAVAIPNFIRTRERARFTECVTTMRQIENAKEYFAQENNLPAGAPATMNELWPTYIRRSTPPECMGGGTYTVGNIGMNVTCTYNTGPFPHVLP